MKYLNLIYIIYLLTQIAPTTKAILNFQKSQEIYKEYPNCLKRFGTPKATRVFDENDN
jgi:hypothetical protein